MLPARDEKLPRPFLKWAGGKTQLLPQFAGLYPPAGEVRRYIEPFVGSAAVFFHAQRLLQPEEVILGDNNEDLINVYTAIRDDVEAVIRRLRRHRAAHSKAHYYHVRGRIPSRLSIPARAARVIYLNKTCFNGLYRVNSRGQFNVPMGRYENPPILDAENLRAVRFALQGVELKVGHFSEILKVARGGDFIYFDPPYRPISPTSSFTSYTQGSFQDSDQEELASVYESLAGRGCRVMLSNSDSPFIRDLYKSFRIRTVQARRSINSKGDRRGEIPELVVLNYTPQAELVLPGPGPVTTPRIVPDCSTPRRIPARPGSPTVQSHHRVSREPHTRR